MDSTKEINYRLIAAELWKPKVRKQHPNVKISNLSFEVDEETKQWVDNERKRIREEYAYLPF